MLWPDFVSPGYIFLSPYRNLDPGPYIYDNYGVRIPCSLSKPVRAR